MNPGACAAVLVINPEHTDAAVITATVVRKWIYDTRIH
jgi:hypothetical protein